MTLCADSLWFFFFCFCYFCCWLVILTAGFLWLLQCCQCLPVVLPVVGYCLSVWPRLCVLFLLCCFSLPVILPVGSPWPLLLCRRKKSLLLTVTQSFRAFFSRTSSGFSHISSSREGPEEALRRYGLCSVDIQSFLRLSSGSGAPWSILHRRVFGFIHDHILYPALPTAAGFRLARLTSAAPSRPIFSSCTHQTKIVYLRRWLTL